MEVSSKRAVGRYRDVVALPAEVRKKNVITLKKNQSIHLHSNRNVVIQDLISFQVN